jgi:hypothetical protein
MDDIFEIANKFADISKQRDSALTTTIETIRKKYSPLAKYAEKIVCGADQNVVYYLRGTETGLLIVDNFSLPDYTGDGKTNSYTGHRLFLCETGWLQVSRYAHAYLGVGWKSNDNGWKSNDKRMTDSEVQQTYTVSDIEYGLDRALSRLGRELRSKIQNYTETLNA